MQDSKTFSFTTKYPTIVRELHSDVYVSKAFDPEKTKSALEFKKYIALWDTGATNSSISSRVVNELKLDEVSKVNVYTGGGLIVSGVYFINIRLPNQVEFPYLVSDRKAPFCHSREGGNPGETIDYLDSRLRGNDKKGTFRSGTK
ncbi:MAG: hypothetical protein P9X24_11770 [Candidatus Hatepunaea meridiana]|nr:hypothetical protein [Candidatus Hatepunaea meridiana]